MHIRLFQGVVTLIQLGSFVLKTIYGCRGWADLSIGLGMWVQTLTPPGNLHISLHPTMEIHPPHFSSHNYKLFSLFVTSSSLQSPHLLPVPLITPRVQGPKFHIVLVTFLVWINYWVLKLFGICFAILEPLNYPFWIFMVRLANQAHVSHIQSGGIIAYSLAVGPGGGQTWAVGMEIKHVTTWPPWFPSEIFMKCKSLNNFFLFLKCHFYITSLLNYKYFNT